jgi:NDP-sugar pyrophosphorylase family protein
MTVSDRSKVGAVILAAGMGTRLRPLTNDRPKALVEVNGTPILHNALRQLSRAGIAEACLVVGYRHEQIRAACGLEYEGVRLQYVQSSSFQTTGSAHSLWLAREFLKRDALVLEGDVFFEAGVLQALLGDDHFKLNAAVAPFAPPLTGTTVDLLPGSTRIARFHRDPRSAAPSVKLFKTVNIYSFPGDFSRRVMLPSLSRCEIQGRVQLFLEELLQELVAGGKAEIAAVDCGGLKWYEIDDESDLAVAREIFPAPGA